MCLVEWHWLIIILFAYLEVASIIFLGLHDKLQIAKVIYAMLNLFCICFCASMCVLVCVCGCACLQVYVHICVHSKMKSTLCYFLFFFFFGVWSWRWMSGPVSWEDFCCMVAPSHSPISSSPGRERTGIWGDRLRLAHKSLPWGPGKNSDIIILRPSVLWSGWWCSPATVTFSW